MYTLHKLGYLFHRMIEYTLGLTILYCQYQYMDIFMSKLFFIVYRKTVLNDILCKNRVKWYTVKKKNMYCCNLNVSL